MISLACLTLMNQLVFKHSSRSLPLKLSTKAFVGNQHKWDSLGPERSGVGKSLGELPEVPVMKSSPVDRLSLHLDGGGLDVF